MKLKLFFVSALALGVFACNQPASEGHEGEEGAEAATAVEETPAGRVFFENLKDGDVVKSPFEVKMGVENLTVEPANGEEKPGFGHHHIIIDGAALAKGTIVPMNETNIHYGKGQTSDTLDLAPGKHTLTMQFADGVHQSWGEGLSSTITITVE